MTKRWIERQLTKSKKSAPMWAELANAVNDILNVYPEMILNRLKTRISLFEEGKEELEVELRELGDFFAIGQVEDSDLPITIMQRQDQVHQKKTIYPMVNTINREFNGMGVTWEPLYAPIDQNIAAYGEMLLTKEDLDKQTGLTPDDFFLTSRGVIRVPMNEIRYSSSGALNEEELREFEATVRRVIYPLIPLRIVCDGQLYYFHFEMSEAKEIIDLVKSELTTTLKSVTERDTIASDYSDNVITKPVMFDTIRTPIRVKTSHRMDAIRCDALRIDKNY